MQKVTKTTNSCDSSFIQDPNRAPRKDGSSLSSYAIDFCNFSQILTPSSVQCVVGKLPETPQHIFPHCWCATGPTSTEKQVRHCHTGRVLSYRCTVRIPKEKQLGMVRNRGTTAIKHSVCVLVKPGKTADPPAPTYQILRAAPSCTWRGCRPAQRWRGT